MKLDLFSLSMLAFIFQGSRCYNVSKLTSTWIHKEDKCDVATPSIQYENEKLTIDTTEKNLMQEVWIGYYQKPEYFEYIGCTSSNGLDNATKQLGVPTPGRCYSACNYTPYIGIEERYKCHCIQTKPVGNIQEQGCNSHCDVASNAVCGGHKYISLYRVLDNTSKDFSPFSARETNKYRNCLLIYVNKTKGKEIEYVWKDCSVRKWVFCSYESDQPITYYQEAKSWKNAATLCFMKGSFPIGLRDISKLSFNDIYAWTGIVWSDVIYSDHGNRKSSMDISYGYVRYDTSLGNYVLQFTKENKEKPTLCEDRQSTTKTPKTPMPNTSTLSITVADFTKIDNTSDSTKVMIKTDRQPTTKTPKAYVTVADRIQRTNNGSSTKGTAAVTVIVSVSVSTVLLVVVMVIILILIKRMKKLCFTGREKSTGTTNRKYTQNTKHVSHVNRSYDLVDIECIDAVKELAEDTYEDTYNMPAQKIDEQSTYETTYETAGNDRETDEENTGEITYDITVIDGPAKLENDNIYNKLHSENNAIYDHTYNKPKNEIQTSDDTYNTAREASFELMCTKDDISGVINTKEDNLYNTTNSDQRQSKQTDNVYNTFNRQ